MDVIGRVDGFLDYHDLIITSETISFDAVIDGNVVKTSKDRTQILDRITYEMNQVIPGYKFLIRLGERY